MRATVARPPIPEDAVAAIFARAAELDLAGPHGDPQVHLDEASLVEVGAAVGLSAAAVRQAVAEQHAGALVRTSTGRDTWVGPRVARAERRILDDPARLRRRLERELERQWFRKVRDQGERSAWCARGDIAARVARRVDLRHRLVLTDVSSIVVATVDCGVDGVAVRLEADLAERRTGLGWGVAGATTGGATAGALLAGLAGLDPAVLVALASAGVGGGSGLAMARRAYLAGVARLTQDLEGMLDRLGPSS